MNLPALQTLKIRGLTIRNRFVKSATYEGMAEKGRVTDRLVEFHANIARQGVGLTTVAYGAVADIGKTFSDQLHIDEGSIPGLQRLTEAVHAEGGAASLQLAHAGGFSKFASKGPSRCLNLYGIAAGNPFVQPMHAHEIAETIESYAAAANHAKSAGFDAVEVHFGHGYLLSQFLSPLTNRRRDDWGGDLERRIRLPLAITHAVRETVGDEFPIFAKTNLQDGIRGGMTSEEALVVATELAAAGIDAFVPSGGMVQKNAFYLLRGDAPRRQMANAETNILQRLSIRILGNLLIRQFEYQTAFFKPEAVKLKNTVSVPVGLLGGVDSAAAVDQALADGFDFVVMGRALLADPDFVNRYASGDRVVTQCNHCNECIANMHQGIHCVLH